MIKDKAQRKYCASKKGKASRKKHSAIYYSTPKGWYNNYKKWAKSREKLFDITLKQFLTFIDVPCYYCGGQVSKVGLDRIDNAIGYTIDNVVSCCTRCNKMKLDINLPEWLLHMQKITSRFNIKIIKD